MFFKILLFIISLSLSFKCLGKIPGGKFCLISKLDSINCSKIELNTYEKTIWDDVYCDDDGYFGYLKTAKGIAIRYDYDNGIPKNVSIIAEFYGFMEVIWISECTRDISGEHC